MEIPAGLVCNNSEVFRKDGINYTLVSGKCIPFDESPSYILDAVDNTMDAVDHDCLDKMGIVAHEDRRDQWATCNLATFDSTPDYIMGDKTVKREFVPCSIRSTCEFQGKLCRTQSQLTNLTPKEILYITHVYQGLLDKEIAQIMGIRIETVRSHSQNIRIKTGLARKADLVRYAQTLNLISQNNEQKNNPIAVSK